jgi:class 3 adenylate cyclase
LRVGIGLGDVVGGSDHFGDGVNIAARCAESIRIQGVRAQVCLSSFERSHRLQVLRHQFVLKLRGVLTGGP